MLATGGCLFHQSTKVRRDGVDVSQAQFDQVTPGRTTAAWVLATLGDPTSRRSAGPADEVWTYAYTEHVDSSGYVLLIFGGNSSSDTTRRAVVEVKDGVVVRKFRG